MEYQKMPDLEGLLELGDLRRAKKCTETKVRFVLQNRKLKSLPKEITETRHIPHLELDLSYNKQLDHEACFQQLIGYPNLKGLGIIKNEIKKLPEAICSLINVETLDLWSNSLKELPQNFTSLSKLRYLNLRNNSLTIFPRQVLALKNLKSLNLRFNKFGKLPEELFELSELEMLDLSSCKISTLPSSIRKLKNLKVLLLESNHLTELPVEIAELQNLTEVNIKGNKELDYEQAFEVISHLPNMKKLNLCEWRIDHLPSSIGFIASLEELNISNNPVSTLPETFAALGNIQNFAYSNTNLSPERILPIVANWPKFTTIDVGPRRLDKEQAISIPDSIGDLRYCEKLSISNAANIPDTIGKLSNLKSLHIRKCSITSLPDLSGLYSLQELFITGNEGLTELSESVFTLPNLKVLNIGRSRLRLDAHRLRDLTNLEELFVAELTEDVIRAANELPKLKKLSSYNEGSHNLPSSYFDIKTIERFSFSDFPGIDVLNTMAQLKMLPSLRHISFSHSHGFPMSFYVEHLQEFKKLEIADLYVGDKEIPATIEKLRHIGLMKIDFRTHYDDVRPFDFPLEYGVFRSASIRFTVPFKALKKASESLQQIDWWRLTNDTNRKIAFGILMGYFDKLAAMMPSPFDQSGKLNNAKVFIAGKLTAGTMKSVTLDLKSRGGTVVKAINEDVTHVLLAPDVQEELIPEFFKHKVSFFLEDHLKAQIIAEDTPYLMVEGNEELNMQITRLLKTKDEDNLGLILEMIEGGGANSILISYLLAVHLFHDNVEIRKKSRNLFRKYASGGLQSHVKEYWKESLREKDIEEFAKLLAHSEVDLCAFVLAFKMVRWHYARVHGKIDQYFEQRFGTIRLSRFKVERLTDAMKDWDFARAIFLEDNVVIEELYIYEKIKALNIQEIYFRGPLKDFPASLLGIRSLRTLGLRSSSVKCEISIPALQQHSGLENLEITGIILRDAGNLSAFTGLTRINLDSNDISALDFLIGMSQLEHIIISRNSIIELPREIERLSKLKSLHVSQAALKRIDIDFDKLPSLEEINISFNAIDYIADQFGQCRRLRRINISNNSLTELPSTFLTIKSESYSGVDLDASQNQIKSLPAIPQNLAKDIRVDQINLSYNKIEAVPDVLLYFKNIYRVILTGNAIVKIPQWLAEWNFSELNLEDTQIEEIPEWLFRLEAKSVLISKNRGGFLLPDADDVPEHNAYIRIHAREADQEPVMQFMKAIEAKRKSYER